MMGLADKYKEKLKEEGINANFATYRPKKDPTRLILAIVIVAIAVPSYLLVFQNYNSCSAYSTSVSGGAVSTNSTITNSFSFKCATNTALYSSVAALAIAVVSLLVLKIIRTTIKKR